MDRLKTPALRGRLQAAFRLDGARTVRDVSPRSPLELRGPFSRGCDGDLYYLRNVSCGIFGGDRYGVDVRVEGGASVAIASSSATKVFTMDGSEARSTTLIEVLPGATLVWGPHATILQAGSSYRQRNLWRVHPGGILLAAEIVAFGRTASGERLAFDRYRSSLGIYGSGREPLYEENADLRGSSMAAIQSSGATPESRSVRPEALEGQSMLARAQTPRADVAESRTVRPEALEGQSMLSMARTPRAIEVEESRTVRPEALEGQPMLAGSQAPRAVEDAARERVARDLAFSLGGRNVLASVYLIGASKGVEDALAPVVAAYAGLAGWSRLPNGAGLVARLLTDSLSEGVAFGETAIGCVLRAGQACGAGG